MKALLAYLNLKLLFIVLSIAYQHCANLPKYLRLRLEYLQRHCKLNILTLLRVSVTAQSISEQLLCSLGAHYKLKQFLVAFFTPGVRIECFKYLLELSIGQISHLILLKH